MDQDMITDITLDHLPDLSEASISFQIPNNASADSLLADRTDGFDLLCNAVDDDASFAPATLRHPRGPPLTLGELTPRVQVTPSSPHRPRSPTPTQVASSSTKPSVIQRPLTLGHCSPAKHRKTPSRNYSIHRPLESVSEERFNQPPAKAETLGPADETPSHVQIHVVESAEDGSVECRSLSHVNSKVRNNALDSPPVSEDLLCPLPEKNDTREDVEPPASHDVVMAPGDDCPADPTTLAVSTRRPESKRNPRKSAQPTVAAGGISKRTAFPTKHVSKKTKGKPSRVREAHPVAPSAARQPTPPQSIAINTEEELVPPACISGDTDSRPAQIMHPNTGGLAERLVSYSQKLISSIGLYKPCPEDSSIEASNDAVRVADARVQPRPPAAAIPPSFPPQCINDISSTHHEPLRLSEISPHKPLPNAPQPSFPAHTGTLQDGRQYAMSPTRPGKKRVSMDMDQQYHRCNGGKTILADADSERGSSDEVVSQAQARVAKKAKHVHENPPVMHSETRDSTRHLDSSKSTLPSARTKYKPKLTSSRCKGPTLDAFPYLSSSRQAHETINKFKGKGKRDERQSTAASVRSESSLSGFSASSRLRQDKRTRQENAIEVSHGRQRFGPASTADLPLIKKPNATLSVGQLTKPVGFTFQVDARLEARKTDERLAMSEPGKTTHPLHPVPELKAHRASHQAAVTFHREGVVPSVPVVPFFFCTEQRAKAREKFDGMVKRKEEEMQRLKEEQRRREAEEEERAIKELRQKAIPKANEVPEWYADMPKRKGTAV